MIAGLPGIGISGIFYLVCAFLMPIIEIKNTLFRRKSKKRWKTAVTQFSFFCGIMAGSWAVGMLLGMIIEKFATVANTPSHAIMHNSNFFTIQPLFISLVTLVLVVGGVQVINLLRNSKLFTLTKKVI